MRKNTIWFISGAGYGQWRTGHSLRLLTLVLTVFFYTRVGGTEILVEAESFSQPGGWVVDQQFIDEMGSPYLLAHGLGKPVGAATTHITFPDTGSYLVFVRTKDWVFPAAPGKFKIAVNGVVLDTVFGTGGQGAWYWHYGGRVQVDTTGVRLDLRDSTGFDGRCDAILFTDNAGLVPPDGPEDLAAFRKTALGLPATPPDAGNFDLVVVGGGVAGICAAVSAARAGLTVALIQNRPVLGGNNSSEVRVGISGQTNLAPFPNLGNILKQVNTGDANKLQLVLAENNITLFLNMHVFHAEVAGGRITAVWAKHIRTGAEQRFPGLYFADCTGDGNLGFRAGADYRMGREGRTQTSESMAPANADSSMMGSTNHWTARQNTVAAGFPLCPWACQFTESYYFPVTASTWQWEGGIGYNTIYQAESIRDNNLKAIYGNWSFLKNTGSVKDNYTNWELDWVSYVAGKRESRRLLGDIILTQDDIQNAVPYPDACVAATWPIDLHYPEPTNSQYFPGHEFYSTCTQTQITAYAFPYRCLYSRNIQNLFMAGRCVSVTHVALGTVRVQGTTGMMGEVIGKAAAVAKQYAATAREVYQDHWPALQQALEYMAPEPTTGMVVDNPEAQVTGSWVTSTYTPGYFGSDYLHDNNEGKGQKSVRYVPTIPAARAYDVFLRFTDGGNRATNVPVVIAHAAGPETVQVNMQSQGGTWVCLGNYQFSAGTGGSVTILNAGTNGYVIADAVRFDTVGTTGLRILPRTEARNAGPVFTVHSDPRNKKITISYQLPRDEQIAIVVATAGGRQLTRLANTYKEAGSYTVTWDTRHARPGIYYFKFSTGSFASIRKGIVLH